MFISKFSVENWQGNQNKGSLKPVKNWVDIETAISELDGRYKTLVTLETDNETHMSVGGGEGKYVVYLTFDNESFYYVVDLSKLDSDESLIVGGQEGVYAAKFCVRLDAALRAAKTFAESGLMDQSVVWEQDRVVEPV